MSERSEFFCPPLGIRLAWEPEGRFSGRAFFWLLFLARQEK
jgi:hypothetical protein